LIQAFRLDRPAIVSAWSGRDVFELEDKRNADAVFMLM